MSIFYLAGKLAAQRDYTYAQMLGDMKGEVKEIKDDPLMQEGTPEQRGRRMGWLSGIPLTLAGGGAAGHYSGRAIAPLLKGLSSGHIPLAALKGLGLGAAAGIGGILAPMTTAHAGAAIGKSLGE